MFRIESDPLAMRYPRRNVFGGEPSNLHLEVIIIVHSLGHLGSTAHEELFIVVTPETVRNRVKFSTRMEVSQ